MRSSMTLARAAALAACLILVGATVVVAQPPDNGGPPPNGGRRFDPTQMFDRMDTNKDGQISKQEFETGMAQMRANRGNRGNRNANNNSGDRMAQFRERMLNRIKDELGATDKEWTVLQPRIEKVMELERATRGGFGFRRGGDTNALPEAEALRQAIDDKSTSAADLQKKTEAYRAAKKKQLADLEAARAKLKEVLTARQEAVLLLNGTLD